MADQVDTSNIDSRMARELFKEYVEAKKAQGEKVDMTYGELVKKLADQMPRLEQRLGGPVRFQVALMDGKVRLRARKVDGAKSTTGPAAPPKTSPPKVAPPASPGPAKKEAGKPPPITKSTASAKPAPTSKPEPEPVAPPPVAAAPEFEEEAEVEIPDLEDVDAAAEELYVGLTGHYATVQAAQAIADYETERIKVNPERPVTEPTSTTPGLSGRWHTIEKVEEKRGLGGIFAIAAILVVVLGGGLYAADRYMGALGGMFVGETGANVAHTKPEGSEKASEPVKAEPEPEPEQVEAEESEEAGVRSLEVEAAVPSVAAAGPEETAETTKTEKAPEPPKVAKAKPKQKKKPKTPEEGPPEAKAEGTDAAPVETPKAEPPPEQPPAEPKQAPPPATPG